MLQKRSLQDNNFREGKHSSRGQMHQDIQTLCRRTKQQTVPTDTVLNPEHVDARFKNAACETKTRASGCMLQKRSLQDNNFREGKHSSRG